MTTSLSAPRLNPPADAEQVGTPSFLGATARRLKARPEDLRFETGPEDTYRATLYNIETFFGWVSDSAAFIDALG
ncbi:hypothetical protein [Paraburkholderia sp. BCC1886]|uniref:hypothetical protein n=1 Tax=Paraburkholderia sp. BCC1886 TaxID=2562670 RepID=UPI0011838C59|nr:hypothetical protein [Paraburkholderia sp. BCC1886]